MLKGLSLYRVAMLAAVVAMPSVGLTQDITSLTAAPVAVAPLVVTPVMAMPDVVAPAPASVSATGPVIVQAGVTRAVAAPTANLNLQATASRRDVAWMIVGGAAIVVGSMVGGDGGTIIMITGAVIGLLGLWRYLQYS